MVSTLWTHPSKLHVSVVERFGLPNADNKIMTNDYILTLTYDKSNESIAARLGPAPVAFAHAVGVVRVRAVSADSRLPHAGSLLLKRARDAVARRRKRNGARRRQRRRRIRPPQLLAASELKVSHAVHSTNRRDKAICATEESGIVVFPCGAGKRRCSFARRRENAQLSEHTRAQLRITGRFTNRRRSLEETDVGRHHLLLLHRRETD